MEELHKNIDIYISTSIYLKVESILFAMITLRAIMYDYEAHKIKVSLIGKIFISVK